MNSAANRVVRETLRVVSSPRSDIEDALISVNALLDKIDAGESVSTLTPTEDLRKVRSVLGRLLLSPTDLDTKGPF